MSPDTRRRVFAVLRVVLALAVIGGFVLFVHDLDGHALYAALAGATLWPIALAIALNFVHMFAKAMRWRVLLAPVRRVSAWAMFRYTVTSYAVSTLLPARLGEVARVWLLKRREGIPATTSTAVALAEKGLEVIALLVVVAPVPWLLPHLPPWVLRSLWLVVALGVGAAAATVGVLAWAGGARPTALAGHPTRTRVHDFVDGVVALKTASGIGESVGWSLVAWGLDVCEVLLVLRAVHAPVPWAATLLILLLINIAVAVPSTPASVGAFELGAIAALDVLGVAQPAALAFALLYHLLQVVPLAAIGLVELRLLRELRHEAEAVSAGTVAEGTVEAGGRERPQASGVRPQPEEKGD